LELQESSTVITPSLKHQAWRQIGRSSPPSAGTKQYAGSSKLVRRLLVGRAIFLGPEAEQSVVRLILFHLAHAPTPDPGLDFV
jgi:hypothetical protein